MVADSERQSHGQGSSSSGSSASASALLESAARNLEGGKLKEAEEYLSRVLALKSSLRDEILQAFLLRGSVQMAAGKPMQAVAGLSFSLLRDDL